MTTHNTKGEKVKTEIVSWSLAKCLRDNGVTMRQIAKHMGVTLKRVRQVKNMQEVPAFLAWNYTHDIKLISKR